MKIRMLLFGLLGAIVLGAGPLQSGEPFVTPSFLKQLEELEEAMSAAESARKGITFLLMEPGST